jgi:hypothetical protein
MASQTYVERPPQIDAEQFRANNPFPRDVDDCGIIAGPHVHLGVPPAPPLLTPVNDTDWVVYAGADGSSVSVMTDADFTAKYIKQTGPKVDPGEG